MNVRGCDSSEHRVHPRSLEPGCYMFFAAGKDIDGQERGSARTVQPDGITRYVDAGELILTKARFVEGESRRKRREGS